MLCCSVDIPALNFHKSMISTAGIVKDDDDDGPRTSFPFPPLEISMGALFRCHVEEYSVFACTLILGDDSDLSSHDCEISMFPDDFYFCFWFDSQHHPRPRSRSVPR
jgi:hypothetical protein